MEPLLKARDVAPMLGVEVSTVLDWFQEGRIPGYRVGGKRHGPVRFRLSEVEATITSWQQNADILDAIKPKSPGGAETPRDRHQGGSPDAIRTLPAKGHA